MPVVLRSNNRAFKGPKLNDDDHHRARVKPEGSHEIASIIILNRSKNVSALFLPHP